MMNAAVRNAAVGNAAIRNAAIKNVVVRHRGRAIRKITCYILVDFANRMEEVGRREPMSMKEW